MKTYLSLIPISAKVRRRQNRMTILCIIISVLLVTTIFSVADMMIRMESINLQNRHGKWHFKLENVSPDVGKEISQRSDVTAVGWSETFNTDADMPYYIGEKKAALCGADNVYLTQIVNALKEGHLPQNNSEVMLSSNSKLALNVEIGDQVTMQTPAGNIDFTVCGFGSYDEEFYKGQTFLVCACLTRESFASIKEQNNILHDPICYIQFKDTSKAANTITEISQYYKISDENISENVAVMGMAGKSNNTTMKNMYGIAGILFVLVLLAGVLMISGSMNSNVAQRTQFFGMMRCIGASRNQIIRYVRLEALNWCKIAVPIGIVAGTIITWGVCAWLHYGVGGEFASAPILSLSPVGIISGIMVGVVTVLLAAGAPAKRASKVSPIAAVSGNGNTVSSVRHTIKRSLGKIESTLGFHHAISSKKNWILMTASFSLSIIMFLCFSVGLDFARALLPTLRSWQPDIVLNGYANEPLLDMSLLDTIGSNSGVDHVFGCTYIPNVSVISTREGVDHANITSYSKYMLDCAKDSLVQGDISEVYGDSNKIMTVLDKDNPIKVGDIIQIAGEELEVVGAVSDWLFASEYSIICSQETFARLTGEHNYSIIGVQLSKNATDETVEYISSLAESNVIFSDRRVENQENANTYLAAKIIMYSFLGIIAMITLFYIINSISMSVTARIKQYGAMRAVGMDGKQLTRMIAAEAFTYAISGLVVGCVLGIVLSRFLYVNLLTKFFGKSWSLPIVLIGFIALFSVSSAIIAIYSPAKRIRNMAVTETISEL